MSTTALTVLADQPLTTPYGTYSTRLYRSEGGDVGLALWLGRVADAELAVSSRLHSSCFTSEGLGALDCDCVGQLEGALRRIATAGTGAVFYLLQEGRGAGLAPKLRDRELVQRSAGSLDTFGAYERLGLPPDLRRYALVPAICRDLGLRAGLRLMTNNPEKLAQLRAAGIPAEHVEHELPSSAFNAEYLAAKARSGHTLQRSAGRHARVPTELDALDPRAERLAGFERVASYALPVRHGGASLWFRATGYAHAASGHERVVLSYRSARAPGEELRHVFRERLLERLTRTGPSAEAYRAAIARIVAHGAGTVLAIPADPLLVSRSPHAGPTEAEDLALLAAHGAVLGTTRWKDVA